MGGMGQREGTGGCSRCDNSIAKGPAVRMGHLKHVGRDPSVGGKWDRRASSGSEDAASPAGLRGMEVRLLEPAGEIAKLRRSGQRTRLEAVLGDSVQIAHFSDKEKLKPKEGRCLPEVARVSGRAEMEIRTSDAPLNLCSLPRLHHPLSTSCGKKVPSPLTGC